MKISLKKKEREPINKLNYGEIHFYYPVSIESEGNIESLYEAISRCGIVLSEEKFLSVQANLEAEANNPTGVAQGSKDLYLELVPGDKEIKTFLKSKELDSLTQCLSNLADGEVLSRAIYGNDYMNSHVRFPLLPFKVELEETSEVWVNAILYAFENKIAILKLELPLIETTMEPLLNNNVEDYITQIEDKWNISKGQQINSFSNLHKMYFKRLHEDLKLNLIVYEKHLENVLLIDYEGMPATLDAMDLWYQEFLFRIICAPVPKGNSEYFRIKAEEYISQYQWRTNKLGYFLSTTGKCLSAISYELLLEVGLKLGVDVKEFGLSVDEKMPIYKGIARDASLNAEYALIMAILERTINYHSFLEKEYATDTELLEHRKKYNKEIIFLCNLKNGAYGSALEQADFFAEKMPYYMKKNSFDLKMKAIDSILEDAENKKRENFQNQISLWGLFFVIVFSLPAIYESASIIKSTVFLNENIPYITIGNASIISWIILCLVIVVIAVRKLKLKKRRLPLSKKR